ncbi:MAG: hypothetical protein V4773_11310 [Verrucomicrobiota bacterium]
MSTLAISAASRMKRFFPIRSQLSHRGTLRDLYTFGLVSVFRRHSVLRVWEPLREAPSPITHHPDDRAN